MTRHLLQIVLLVVTVMSALVVEPRLTRADSRLQDLQGFSVIVTTRDGLEVRGWLVRVGPKRLLIGRYNNTFVRVLRRNVARVTRDAKRPTSPYIHEPDSAISTATFKPAKGKVPAIEITARERLRKAKLLRNVGIGITVSGIVIFVGGWTLAVIDISINRLMILGVGVGAGFGGVTLGAGTPIWTVGSVRHSILRAGRRWKSRRRAWIRGGMVATISGSALAGIGAGLVTAGVVAGTPGILSGSVLLGVGFFMAVHVGIPMWVAAHRFRGESPSEKNNPVVSHRASHRTQGPAAQSFDAIGEAHLYSRLTLGNPRATVFSTGFRF